MDASGTSAAALQHSKSAPAEVQAPAANQSYYAVAKEDNLRRPYFVPEKYLKDIVDIKDEVPKTPLIVFINAKSGGLMGSDLAVSLNRALSRAQVFDLAKYRPDKVLKKLWENLDNATQNGDTKAAQYRANLRILVAGGDGTIAWVLGVIRKLKLQPEPPVAMIPMGTGNDLSRSFNWGPAFDKGWISSFTTLYSTLARIAEAQTVDLDCWKLSITFPTEELLQTLPASMHSVPKESGAEPGTSAPAAGAAARGLFWNYMSVGLDAKSAYQFHSLRNRRPDLTASRLMNQYWYMHYSSTSGWLCCTKPLTSKVSLEVIKAGSTQWEQLQLPENVKAVVLLNLQSYAGGRNLWGPKTTQRDKEVLKQKEPNHADGLLEVVGLTHGWHTGLVMATKGSLVHAKRLCQVSAIRLHLKASYVRADGAPSHCYMQIDGEPWCQDVPSSRDTAPITVEVRHAGVSKVLENRISLRPNAFSQKLDALLEMNSANPAEAITRAATTTHRLPDTAS
mmetsp:Transcript_9143/g.19598  ORF Transcript_9143/g.19598 Transcript_9143/m.19598 type:complete len:507 (+) Transcript_9143:45-1565(+)